MHQYICAYCNKRGRDGRCTTTAYNVVPFPPCIACSLFITTASANGYYTILSLCIESSRETHYHRAAPPESHRGRRPLPSTHAHTCSINLNTNGTRAADHGNDNYYKPPGLSTSRRNGGKKKQNVRYDDDIIKTVAGNRCVLSSSNKKTEKNRRMCDSRIW